MSASCCGESLAALSISAVLVVSCPVALPVFGALLVSCLATLSAAPSAALADSLSSVALSVSATLASFSAGLSLLASPEAIAAALAAPSVAGSLVVFAASVGAAAGSVFFRRLGCRRLAWRRSEVGEQFLPVELAVLLARGPGLQALAADFAEHHFLLGQVQGGSGHVEAGELGQRLALGRIDAEVGEFQRGLVEQQLGVLGQVQAIVAGEADHAVLQHQRGIVADIGPPGLELDILDAQVAPGRDRHQGQVAFPVEAAAVRAGGDQGHLRAVVGQGAEVVQLEAQRIEAEVHRLARSQVLEVQAALGQLDAVDAQRERVARLFRLGRFARRDPEQAGQVELALLVEQQFRYADLPARRRPGAAGVSTGCPAAGWRTAGGRRAGGSSPRPGADPRGSIPG
ncbi:Uncharacterised protein [Pseudomonas aeruginosa]|nr:Uncharacterised protein [Pseudomonas aeruginosa]